MGRMIMRKTIIFLAAALTATACYSPYVKNYDYSAVYIAYQYDLRSLIVGEGMSFNVGAVLGGVINNDMDRNVEFVVDDALLTGSLEEYGGTTAIEGLKNSPSQSYVSAAIEKAGIENVIPVPKTLYGLDKEGTFVIKKGSHTGTICFKADSLAFISDPKAGQMPYYAFAWRISGADADKVPAEKSFGIVALRLENMFFGSWYHGGRSWRATASGDVVPGSESVYPAKIPSGDGSSNVYALTTSGAYGCTTNYFHNKAGKMTIGMEGGKVSVSGEGISDLGCGWNRAAHIQDRKIYLNYKYTNGDGSFTVVADTLSFRNREHDGVNEWQN